MRMVPSGPAATPGRAAAPPESWLGCATIARMPARAAVAMTAGVLAERTIKAWSPRECCITETVTGLLIRRVITWLVNRAIAA